MSLVFIFQHVKSYDSGIIIDFEHRIIQQLMLGIDGFYYFFEEFYCLVVLFPLFKALYQEFNRFKGIIVHRLGGNRHKHILPTGCAFLLVHGCIRICFGIYNNDQNFFNLFKIYHPQNTPGTIRGSKRMIGSPQTDVVRHPAIDQMNEGPLSYILIAAYG